MTTEEFLRELDQTFTDCLVTAKNKNKDYANSDDPFKNFRMSEQVGVSPARAILVRISDKLSRISNLLDREGAVTDERIEDSLMDMINYSAILKAYLKTK